MVNSSYDMLGFVAAINRRHLPGIGEKLLKRHGVEYNFPEIVVRQMVKARELHQRYIDGDYRHTVNEAKELRDLANWLVIKHRELNGQSDAEREAFEFDPHELSTALPIEPESYREICRQLLTRW